jgi:hypothetical protein
MLLKFAPEKSGYGYKEFKKFKLVVSSFYEDIDVTEKEKFKLLKTMLAGNALIWFHLFTATNRKQSIRSLNLFLLYLSVYKRNSGTRMWLAGRQTELKRYGWQQQLKSMQTGFPLL